MERRYSSLISDEVYLELKAYLDSLTSDTLLKERILKSYDRSIVLRPNNDDATRSKRLRYIIMYGIDWALSNYEEYFADKYDWLKYNEPDYKNNKTVFKFN